MKFVEDICCTSLRSTEKRDCGVRALSSALGVEYCVVHALLKKHGREDRHGTSMLIAYAAALELGYRLIDVTGQYKARTPRSLEKEVVGETRFVWATRHFFPVVKGKINDHTKGSRKRIHGIYKPVQSTLTKKQLLLALNRVRMDIRRMSYWGQQK